MTAAASPGGLLPTRALFHESWKWLRKNWIRTLVFSIISFAIAWAWNVWIMARKLEGSVAEPGSSTTATAQGHTWNGLYWLLCTTILFGLITYGREKGFKNLIHDFVTPPFTFFDNLFRRPRSAIAMGCWGAALALLVGSVVSNAISGLLGLGFLLAAPTALAIVLNNVLIRAWIGAFSAAQPRLRTNATSLANPYAMMFGEAVGALLAWRMSGALVPVILALILIVLSFVAVAGGAGKSLPNPMPLILLIGAGIVAWKVLQAQPARADDGGWSECATASGDPCSQLGFFKGWWEWRKSAGADVVIRQARVGGTFSALGCLAGCMLGGGLAAVAAAFGSSSTGGLGSAGATPPGGAPAGGAPAAGAGHGVASSLGQPPAGQPGGPLPQPGAPHGAAQASGATASPAGTPPAAGAPSAGAATPGSPPAPTPVARAGNLTPGQPPPPPPGAPGGGAPPAAGTPAGAPHGIAQGTEGLQGHPGQPADVTPTGATRSAPDVTPGSAPGAGTPAAGTPAGAPHGIAQGTEGLQGHPGQPADVTPTGATRSAPDVTPGSAPGAGTPAGRPRPTASPKAPKASKATQANPQTSPPPAPPAARPTSPPAIPATSRRPGPRAARPT